MRKITLITTGGTIEKTYDETTGELVNRRSIVRRMLEELRLEDTEVNILELMSKDSLHMTDADRARVVKVVRAVGADADSEETGCGSEGAGPGGELAGVVILHGTDTLTDTGGRLHEEIPRPRVPIVLTGAMRPFEMKHADALQNLTEALFAAGVLPPGIHCVAHGRALTFPGVIKDRDRGTFVYAPGARSASGL